MPYTQAVCKTNDRQLNLKRESNHKNRYAQPIVTLLRGDILPNKYSSISGGAFTRDKLGALIDPLDTGMPKSQIFGQHCSLAEICRKAI